MAGTGKCLLVTGPPGVGKSTLIMRVFESLKASNPNLKVQGFYTREVRQAGQRVGFEVVTLDGRTCPLASANISSPESLRWPSVGKYKVDITSFESLALPELQVREDTDLFVIDEVGKMELYSSSFFPEVLKVLESSIPILASIPIPKFGRDIPAGQNLSQDLIGMKLKYLLGMFCGFWSHSLANYYAELVHDRCCQFLQLQGCGIMQGQLVLH